MADVARVAGVSQQTVSRVLNDFEFVKPATRDRVWQSVEQLGYRPNMAARTLATSSSKVIGVVATELREHSGPAGVLWAVERAAEAAGFGISIVSLQSIDDRSVRGALDRLRAQAVDGIVVIAPENTSVQNALFSLAAVPYVTLSATHSAPDGVEVDQSLASRMATRHLIELGHRAIVHVAGPGDFVVAAARIRGWQAEMADAGLVAREPYVGDWSAASGYRIGLEIAGSDATAAFVANDQMAQGMLLALHEAGIRVPEEFSVIGFDDIAEAAYFIPPLTTIRQDFSEFGKRLVDIVLAKIRQEEPGASAPFEPQIVVRRSTGAVPSQPRPIRTRSA